MTDVGKYINPLIKTCHNLHDSGGQLKCHAISDRNVVLVVGEPEFMVVFMDKEIATDLIKQIEDALEEMKRRG